MTGSGPFTYQIDVPSDSILPLYYIFHAKDSSNNWAETNIVQKEIRDDDKPVIEDDLSPLIAYTGDEYTFDVIISDNIGLQTVTVEYWFGFGTHNKVPVTGSGQYQLTITIPLDSLDTLHYMIEMSDTSDNSNGSATKNVQVEDNDKPNIGIDSSSETGMTGDPYIFEMEAEDNIGIEFVRVNYWFGKGQMTFQNLTGSGPYYLEIIIPDDSLDVFHFYFNVSDTSGNWNWSTVRDVPIRDNDRPTMDLDDTPEEGTTGDPFIFTVEMVDNIGIGKVWVEYWFGDGAHANISMILNINYEVEIIIPSDSLESLFYIFHANDTSDNWRNSFEKEVAIMDNDPPMIEENLTPDFGTTGDPFLFRIDCMDNIGVQSVHVAYKIGNGDINNDSLEIVGGEYILEIIIPNSTSGQLVYSFHLSDHQGNRWSSDQASVPIYDNDPANITNITGSLPRTGETYLITFEVSDNIGIMETILYYRFGSGEWETASLGAVLLIDYGIEVPINSLDALEFKIETQDTSGNWTIMGPFEREVLDVISPMVFDNTTDLHERGQSILFNFTIVDNIGIKEVILRYWYTTDENVSLVALRGELLFNHSLFVPFGSLDDLHYYLEVRDQADNTHIGTNLTINLTDRLLGDAFPDDPAASVDSDGDGFPDEWNPGMSAENSTTDLRLDAFPEDPAASLDEDNDGFPDEWNEGMTEEDSTSGLRIDKFPRNPKEWKDSDGDGIGDNADTFNSINNRVLYAILALVIFIVLTIVGVFFFLVVRKGSGFSTYRRNKKEIMGQYTKLSEEWEQLRTARKLGYKYTGESLIISLMKEKKYGEARRMLMDMENEIRRAQGKGFEAGGIVKHDVFISYSSFDKEKAFQLCGAIESKGLTCWIAPRNVTPGKNYGQAIMDGIRSSKVMVLLFSSHSNKSPQVVREVERAVSNKLEVIPIRLENVKPSGGMEYFISASHWMDVYMGSLDSHMKKITDTVLTEVKKVKK
jgi:hypothetical protein